MATETTGTPNEPTSIPPVGDDAPILETEGVCVSMHLEAADDFGLTNGRETGAYVLGFWRRHLREVPYGWNYAEDPIELLVRIRTEHLGGVSALLIMAGAAINVWETGGHGVMTIRICTLA